MPLAQDENQFIYHGFHQDPQLSRYGLAPIQGNGLLQLTKGHAFYPFSVKINLSFSQSLSFSTNFVFAIIPAQHPSLGADGIAFVVVPTVEYSSQPEILPGAYLGLSGNLSTIGWSENNISAISKQPVQWH